MDNFDLMRPPSEWLRAVVFIWEFHMNRLRLAPLAAIVVAVLVIQACGDSSTTAPTTPSPSAAVLAVEDYFEAFNEGDIEGLKGLYSAGVVIEIRPLVPDAGWDNYTGLAAVLENDRDHIGLHSGRGPLFT